MEDVERLVSREALRELSGRWKGLEWVGRSIKMMVWKLPLMVFGGCCVSAFYAHTGLMLILFGGVLDPTSSKNQANINRGYRVRYMYMTSGAYAISFISCLMCDASVWVGYIAVTLFNLLAGCGAYFGRNRRLRLEQEKLQATGYMSS